MKILSFLDLVQNELRNAREHNLASPPSSPVLGQIYYDTALGYSRVWDGTGWQRRSFLADVFARANHTGTQLAATISDFNTAVRTSRLDQMAAPTASVSLNSQKITSLLDPTAAQDGATKNYVDAAINGIDWKASVRVATTATGTLASAYENSDTVDGVTLATGDRILVKNQSTGSENGIYTVNASGAPTRATDADVSADVTAGMAVFVEEGTANGNQQWVLTTDGPITLGTTALVFAQIGASGSAPTAGGGLTLASNTYDVGAGNGITVDADAVKVDPGVVARKYTVLIGDGSATSIAVTHSLNNQHPVVAVYEVAANAEVICDVVGTSTSAVTITFATAPASNAYRVSVVG